MIHEYFILEETKGKLENMVNLTYTDKAMKKMADGERDFLWHRLLLHIHECKSRKESYEKACNLLESYFLDKLRK